MRTLTFTDPSLVYNPQLAFSSSILDHFPTRFRRNRKYQKIAVRKRLSGLRNCSVSDFVVSSASEYQGWDDPRLGSVWGRTGESNQLIDFMVSIGIDDKKYVYVFVLGVVCALAISRVRLASIVVLPASVVVFALGFSFGFVRSVSDFDVSGGFGRKERSGDDGFGIVVEKLSSVVSFFDKLDARIGGLRNVLNRAVVDKHVTLGELERCVVELDSARSLAVPSRAVLDACVVELSRSSDGVVETKDKGSGKKAKEPAAFGFGFLKSVGAVFGDKSNDLRSSRAKDSKKDSRENARNGHSKGGVAADSVKETDFNMLSNDGEVSKLSYEQDLGINGVGQSGHNAKRVGVTSWGEESDPLGINGASNKFNAGEAYSYSGNKMRFADNGRLSFKMRHRNETETWSGGDSILDSSGFSFQLKRTQTEASFKQEQLLNSSIESLESSQMFEHDEEEISIPRVKNGSSCAISNDVLFDRHLTEANDLLKQARDCLKDGDAEDVADDMLYRSSALLIRALDMKPMSLLAVGLLGNTYLLHGELKLKVSRQLRARLRKNSSSRRDWQGRDLDSLDGQVLSKDKLATLLVNTCEECEHLLVEAGRKYRMALSIDGNDVRALYNWGLALSFRAQLIADIGPEAAPDADKVFMAAIDKFDAMMSKGSIYAPDALYRWGAALQQRSRLRPGTSKEKVKLLQQAKQLYEDALDMDSSNTQAREALLRCSSELDY
ncbi:unnamed protein product [Rhodiola kirilowii]